MEKKIWFVLNTRFPTEKAYGVTTGMTARAVNEISGFQSCVITPQRDLKEESPVESIEVKMPLGRVYNHLFQSRYFSKMAFVLWKFPYAMKVAIVIRKVCGVVWVRDVALAFLFRLLGFTTVCEIHRRTSMVPRLMLKWLGQQSRVTIVFITERLRATVGIQVKSYVIFGMAVDKRDLNNSPKRINFDNLVVGYLGSSHSSGNLLTLDSFINTASIALEKGWGINFQVVGISRKEIDSKFQNSIPPNIKFHGRVRRSEVFDLIDTFDIGTVVYPDTEYFQDSFPIKIAEYAARKILILASDTHAHRGILGDDKALYFDPQAPLGFLEEIEFIRENPDIAICVVENAFNWVKKSTYQARAASVLNSLQNGGNESSDFID